MLNFGNANPCSYDLNRPKTLMKKSLLLDDNCNQIEPRTGFIQFMSTRRNNADVLPVSLRTRVFCTCHVHNGPY